MVISAVSFELRMKKFAKQFSVAGWYAIFAGHKAMPKELLPVVNKPLIQYAVEEAVSAGMTR